MKVKEIMDDLQKANPNADVHIITANGEVEILSIYSPEGDEEINKKSKELYIDVGTEEDDEEFMTTYFGENNG